MNALVEIQNLSTYFKSEQGVVKAVDALELRVHEGETVCIVGESGCGKSAAAMSLMRLIPEAVGSIVSGEIWFAGRDLRKVSKEEMRKLRGNELAMIFQEPMSSLNPVLTIGEQIMEPIMEHQGLSKKAAQARAIELIELVGIPRAKEIAKSYPYELSGGMLQRIMIAIAISCNPRLLIADEPTTALDVTIQAQILDLLRKIKDEAQTAILFITHDLGVVAEMADHVVVMYAGKVVEVSPVVELFEEPKHPYTQGLLRSKPVLNQRRAKLYSIPGQVPNPTTLGESCYFHDRCDQCLDICRVKQPPLRDGGDGRKVACWLYEEESVRGQ
ncbi:ABC transporter ATP-binding protein [Brevibacillus porteri]|uniref:Dipeptide/oligopeptide/nickel ABC transporter ATP-binding protein n=1 Tax=Brevibacillus porteri TaxID=2126350 RepID=A0ABX5FMY3_9BACL|nr:ABC transporter ATP-binding protein [Brevibacillus porteri]MED1802781.1 ABC transporter ATP-binding protein [Brevibacillus porteri]MED2131618.1 ABC transporter ATP-binding protein [Brevibacillus porteri]MED2746146.1 ABC transporter ATP-binding protein [Brevibacillus porteri]MED2817101.1 ABC transporter ATP-binding protein [Brevibacillus porteri]MED2892354.1 ABC transporter ATP-binding protein [Brevibacillus porteri]